MRVGYRVRQGMLDLLAFARPVDHNLAAHYLNAAQLRLFEAMTRSEQLHSLGVLRSVLAQTDYTPPDLAVAALLHDCGKTRYALNIFQRTIVVLVKKLAPKLEQRWSADEPTPSWWRTAFIVRRHHPIWSAAALQSTGASERAIWLVEHHADDLQPWAAHPYQALLQRLKQADDVN